LRSNLTAGAQGNRTHDRLHRLAAAASTEAIPLPNRSRNSLQFIAEILNAAGSGLDRVVQMTMLITDPADYDACNAEYVKHFPGRLPARQTARFGVATEAKVAFSCIACARESGPSDYAAEARAA
jgi:enamine deaminase RidA (YjgF/YER057c/UK114 family)